MNTKEKNNFNPETNSDNEALRKLGEKQHEQLRKNLENSVEKKSPEKSAESARREALDNALTHEKVVPKEESRETSPAERRNGAVSTAKADASFNAAMDEIHPQMSAPSRAFSKVIHNKAVEKASEVTGNTVARPDAILSGAVFAFLLTLGVYLVAKNLGYPLSGFETIGAFALGWALGLAYDFLKVMVTGRK